MSNFTIIKCIRLKHRKIPRDFFTGFQSIDIYVKIDSITNYTSRRLRISRKIFEI